MEDPRYVNIHLNTPGYRTYRPAWKMIAWHVKGNSAKQNDRKDWVLDRLSDAQKQANTTRGSTAGLINPALGDVIGNRVALPVLTILKRGSKRPKAKANSTPTTQPAQAPQPPQPTRARRKRRAHEAPQIPEAAQGAQGAQGDNSSAWSAPFPAVSATMGTPSQNVAVETAAPVTLFSA